MRLLIIAAAALLALAGLAYAEEQSVVLWSVSETEVVAINAKGEKELVRVSTGKTAVVPGNEIIFTTFFENRGKKPADNIILSNPIPPQMLLKGSSADVPGTIVRYSIDGGKTYDRPENLFVVERGIRRPATISEYTDIQWEVLTTLKPGEKRSVSYRATIK